MNKTELIDKLLHLGSTIEICNSTQTSKKAKELAHNLLDEYLKAINYTRCCETLPTKEEMVAKWYNKVFKNNFKFRKVFKDVVDDAYYSGALDMHKELTK